MSVARARSLRQTPSDAEKRLWSKLRGNQLNGEKFRRQHPLGPYVLDFFCERTKLVVEVDGGQHAEQIEADLARTRWLENKGCRVIRFWNNEVLLHTEEVLETIRLALNAAPHPRADARAPLPQGEGLDGLGAAKPSPSGRG